MILADNTTYEFDGQGFISRALDNLGRETTYQAEQNPLGWVQTISTERSGIERKFGPDGGVVEITDAAGTTFLIESADGIVSHRRIHSARAADGTFYQISYNVAGNKQFLRTTTVEGRTYLSDVSDPAHAVIISVTEPDQTVIQYVNNKPSRATTPDGRIYDYV